MPDAPATPLSTGDRAPNCTGVTAEGTVYASEAQAGRAVVMLLAQNLDAPGLHSLLDAFSARADEIASHETDLVAILGDNIHRVLEFKLAHPSRVILVGALDNFLERNGINEKVPDVLAGSPRDFLKSIGFNNTTPEVLVLDRNQRVAGRILPNAPSKMVAESVAIVNDLPNEKPRDICAPAPVLILPNLFDAAFCQELITFHQENGNMESPSLYYDDGGHPGHKLNHRLKKRRDCLLEREHPLSVRINDLIMRRCIPEIKRCFQAEVTHTDRYNIACYPGDGGHFRRHRDNRPELVAFRRFALSINLTPAASGYEGGYLRLPEFNDHHYRCPTGAGVIFSVALLHEITPVLSGNRYVLITHLHDEEGEARWLAMRQALAGAA